MLPDIKDNHFSIPSCGDQFPATQMLSGSFEFGLAMPMAQSHISTVSTEGNFIPTFQNVEGEITSTAGQELLADSTTHFFKDEALGPKILEVFCKIFEGLLPSEV